MSKFGRRTFLKVMGQFSAILCVGLSQKRVLAQGNATSKKRPKRITVEEHIMFGNGDVENIDNRLKDMDETGIDMQVLSTGGATSDLNEQDAIISDRKTNENLAEIVSKYPDRFAAFCKIPWQYPTAAVAELERAVKELGLKGIKMDGTIKGEYLDAKKFRPVLKKAEELGTPIFIHIGENGLDFIKTPSGDSRQRERGVTLYEAHLGELDVSVHAVRLIHSGVFDEYPNLKFILGHMGAGLPFWSVRLNRGGKQNLKKLPSEYIKENFYYATSGNLSYPAFMCCYLAVGAEHILFAVDYPPDPNKEAVEFLEHAPISDSAKEKIYHLNAESLFGI